jgi:hypothetical protein
MAPLRWRLDPPTLCETLEVVLPGGVDSLAEVRLHCSLLSVAFTQHQDGLRASSPHRQKGATYGLLPLSCRGRPLRRRTLSPRLRRQGHNVSSDEVVYPLSELARRHGAGVPQETSDPDEAYADIADDVDTDYQDGWLPG